MLVDTAVSTPTVSIPKYKRIVIKVGSALVAPDGRGCSNRYLLPIAQFISLQRQRDVQVVLVSSGAVAAGKDILPEQPRWQRSIPEKQAFAAIGQARLMETWNRFFDFPCAQILLTYDDLNNRRRFVNAQNALIEIMRLGALPIVNENDSVAVDELKLGDNDNLAAHVAVLVEADLLLILSDVNGLYTANPQTDPDALLIPEVHDMDDSIETLAGDSVGPHGTGGMITKLQAAKKATSRGIDTIIANGRQPQSLEHLGKGLCPGTLFHRKTSAIAARKHWLQHALTASGTVEVDAGAAKALLQDGASLLPSGVIGLSGSWRHGEAVTVVHKGMPIAKGLCQYGSDALARIKGHKSSEIQDILGYSYHTVIIHRGDMVMFHETTRSQT